MDIDEITDLTSGAMLIIRRALELAKASGLEVPGINHWLSAALERHGPMAEGLARIDAGVELRVLGQRLARGEFGDPLEVSHVALAAQSMSRDRGVLRASEADVLAAILTAAGYTLSAPESGPPVAAVDAPSDAGPSTRMSAAPASTPTLERFGRDLTTEASEGRLLPVVGRDAETTLVIETLCRRTKRNPALIGPAGVGKTAIIEGLAQRIVAGNVPAPLKGCRVLAIQPTGIVAGASMAGEFEKRLDAIIQEARTPGIILFIDEVHSLIGAGGRPGTTDAASIIKPALARGDLACIVATTDDEYRRWIEPDHALERRFQPVRVQEITPEQAMAVLVSVRDDLGKLRDVAVSDAVLDWILKASIQHFRNRYLPDKAIDLLEQTIAHAVTMGLTEADIATAKEVTERMIGMPVEQAPSLERLAGVLAGAGLLPADDAEDLVARLQVTTRGLDIRPGRPNAVLLLMDEARQADAELCEIIAAQLFGAADRVVDIDLGQMLNGEDITRLLGAPPAYVGYGDALPLHQLIQTPWCVLRLDNIDACHPNIRGIVGRALEEGFFTDSQGRRIYVSDTVVVLTAQVEVGTGGRIGFETTGGTRAGRGREVARSAVGSDLVEQCDLVCCQRGTPSEAPGKGTAHDMAALLSERYRQHGLEIRWDDSFIEWLSQVRAMAENERDCERVLDEELAPKLLLHIANEESPEPRRIVVCRDQDGIRVKEA